MTTIPMTLLAMEVDKKLRVKVHLIRGKNTRLVSRAESSRLSLMFALKVTSPLRMGWRLVT
jgi:hypothetical protein